MHRQLADATAPTWPYLNPELSYMMVMIGEFESRPSRPSHHYAISAKGDPEEIAELGHILARAGANIEKPNIHGSTPVFCAVVYDNAETFRTLYRLSAGLEVRVDGDTVLHQAAYWGTCELFSALREAVPDLRADPDLDMNREMGRSAMDALEWRVRYGMLSEQKPYVTAGTNHAVPPLNDDEIDAFQALIREIREHHNFPEGRGRRYVQEAAPAKAAMPGGWSSDVKDEIDGESDKTEDAASDGEEDPASGGADDGSCGDDGSWETAPSRSTREDHRACSDTRTNLFYFVTSLFIHQLLTVCSSLGRVIFGDYLPFMSLRQYSGVIIRGAVDISFSVPAF
ncbi:hypothetical protein DL764_006722 [Monosporascus ibericus]|uniref:Uncharacterized protein n=1 Tax=Monosporascus ibericus TaxID=155417 RepID=A0A4Q4T407_9PEZI|nr:hypothetical protein DL764_006722 [Monosporascus ibericus]